MYTSFRKLVDTSSLLSRSCSKIWERSNERRVFSKVHNITKGNMTNIWRRAEKTHPNGAQRMTQSFRGFADKPTILQVLKKDTDIYQKKSRRKLAIDETFIQVIASGLQSISKVANTSYIKFGLTLEFFTFKFIHKRH